MSDEKLIIYQVFTRLFGNNNNHCINNGSITENGCGKMADFTAKALGEIKKLGATHIWYTGIIEHATQTDYRRYNIRPDHPAIVKGKAGSPYAIKDYYDVDPDLAKDVPERMREFENLVQRTHRSGLKVIIDFVPNHVARQYHSDMQPDGTSQLGANDDTDYAFSPYNNFYYIPQSELHGQFDMKGAAAEPYKEFPAKATGNNRFDAYPNINDWYETVKLNYGVDYQNGGTCHFNPIPDTWNKMLDILMFWAEKHIDGFRCDMAEMVPVEFWEWAIPQVKAKYPAEIGFFRYCSERKQWEVVLNDQLPLALRRGMTAEQITSFSPCFVQIHQSYIINIDYLMLIRDNRCVLYPPFDKITELLVSKKFKKELQERFCL